MDNDHISLSLELDISGESLTGHARNGTGAARSFAGWLGLLGAIDALVAEKGGRRPTTKTNRTDTRPIPPERTTREPEGSRENDPSAAVLVHASPPPGCPSWPPRSSVRDSTRSPRAHPTWLVPWRCVRRPRALPVGATGDRAGCPGTHGRNVPPERVVSRRPTQWMLRAPAEWSRRGSNRSGAAASPRTTAAPKVSARSGVDRRRPLHPGAGSARRPCAEAVSAAAKANGRATRLPTGSDRPARPANAG